MKAAVYTRYGSPEVLRLEEVAKPTPKGDEVLIKVYATTVTVADTRVRSFTVPPSVWLPARIVLGIRKPKKTILGAELAGEVEAVGQAVTRFKRGDQVFADATPHFGAYAEYVCLPGDGAIATKPSAVSFEEAAAIPIGGLTALHFLRKAEVQRGQSILIYGASGSVGTFAVQLAKHFGAEVTGVCSAANVEMVKSLGADKVIDYTQEDFTRNGETYDVIFAAVNKCPFSACVGSLTERGVYVNITEPLPSLQMLWTSMTSGKRFILGQSLSNHEGLSVLKDLLETEKLSVVIDRCYPLEQIAQAHGYVDKGHKRGNVVITMEHGDTSSAPPLTTKYFHTKDAE